MASLTRYLLLCVICAIPRHAIGQNVSKAILDFLSVFNGKWDNRVQISVTPAAARALVESRFIPVEVPLLGPKAVVYFENAIRGKVISLYLCVVTQDETNPNIINLTPYNFANASDLKPGSYNIDNLRNLTREDLVLDNACTADVVSLGGGLYSVGCPTCDDALHGQHPDCYLVFTCDSFTMFSSRSFKRHAGPDVLQLAVPRYPLVNAPGGYISPCHKRHRDTAIYTQG